MSGALHIDADEVAQALGLFRDQSEVVSRERRIDHEAHLRELQRDIAVHPRIGDALKEFHIIPRGDLGLAAGLGILPEMIEGDLQAGGIEGFCRLDGFSSALAGDESAREEGEGFHGCFLRNTSRPHPTRKRSPPIGVIAPSFLTPVRLRA